MIEAQTALVFVIGSEASPEIIRTLEDIYSLHHYDDVKSALTALQNIRCDIVLIDDTLLDQDVIVLIQGIRQRFQSLPIILLTNSAEPAYQRQVRSAGANEIFLAPVITDELAYRLELLLDQSQQQYALLRLNRNLHLLASLPRLLDNAPDPQALTEKAARLNRSMLGLHGTAIALLDNDALQFCVSSDEILDNDKVNVSVLQPQQYDPWLWAIRNRATQVYQDVKLNPNFMPIAGLSSARAVVIVPLVDRDQTIGAMGFFPTPDDSPTDADVMIYEQVGEQLVLALNNAQHRQQQLASLQSSEHLLRAWQFFSRLHSAAEIARNLREMIEPVPNIAQVVLWLDADPGGAFTEIMEATRGSLTTVVSSLWEQNHLLSLLYVNGEFQSVVLRARATRDPIVKSVMDRMQARAILVVPVTQGADLRGLIVAGITDENSFQPEHIALIEHLTHIASLSLNRITLVGAMSERSSRLEGILRGLSEGVFFVNENDKVAYCNPQIAEITGISAAAIVDQESDILLRTIAATTDHAAEAYAQLQTAKNAMLSQEYLNQDYPIVELRSAAGDRELSIEFMKIQDSEADKISWAGVIHNESRSRRPSKLQDQIVTSISESLRMPYAQVRSLMATLVDDHGHFSYRDRQMLLDQAKTGIDRVGQLWNSFLEAYQLELGDITLKRENVDMTELLHRVVNAPYAGKSRRKIEMTITSDLPIIRLDAFYVRSALVNITQHALDVSPEDSVISIFAEWSDGEICITVVDAGNGFSQERLDQIFEPIGQPGAVNSNFALYVAREMIRRHGGRVWAENHPGGGTAIHVALPSIAAPKFADGKSEPRATDTTSQFVKADSISQFVKAVPETPIPVPQLPIRVPSRAPNRAPQMIMIVTGQSTVVKAFQACLAKEYNVLEYETGAAALQDIPATRWDMIVIDIKPVDISGIELCSRIRAITESPILLVADSATDSDKVRGLNMGADDYITRPISDDEMMARVQVIFKRQQLPARMSEPLAIGDLYIDLARREVTLANKPLDLTRIEYDLLYLLVTNRGQVLSHKQLLEKVWGPDYVDETQYLWVNISRLRKKLESKNSPVHYIHTEPGTGYFFDAL